MARPKTTRSYTKRAAAPNLEEQLIPLLQKLGLVQVAAATEGPKRRGRPRKNIVAALEPPKRRGRPRKNTEEPASVTSATTAELTTEARGIAQQVKRAIPSSSMFRDHVDQIENKVPAGCYVAVGVNSGVKIVLRETYLTALKEL